MFGKKARELEVKEYTDLFWDQHKDFFERNEFKRKSSARLLRKSNDIFHEIRYGPTKRKDGIYHTVSFGIVYPVFNKVQKEIIGTRLQFGKPLYLLKDEGYGLWYFKSKKDLRKGKRQIEWKIKTYGFEYFKNFNNSCELYRILRSSKAKDFYMGGNDSPVEISLFMFIKEGPESALKYLAKKMKEEHTRITKNDLERIKRYLESEIQS